MDCFSLKLQKRREHVCVRSLQDRSQHRRDSRRWAGSSRSYGAPWPEPCSGSSSLDGTIWVGTFTLGLRRTLRYTQAFDSYSSSCVESYLDPNQRGFAEFFPASLREPPSDVALEQNPPHSWNTTALQAVQSVACSFFTVSPDCGSITQRPS